MMSLLVVLAGFHTSLALLCVNLCQLLALDFSFQAIGLQPLSCGYLVPKFPFVCPYKRFPYNIDVRSYQ